MMLPSSTAAAGKGKIRQATDAAADYASDAYMSAKVTANSGASYAQDAASVGKQKGKHAANDKQVCPSSASKKGKQAAGSAQQYAQETADIASRSGKQAAGSAQQSYNQAADAASKNIHDAGKPCHGCCMAMQTLFQGCCRRIQHMPRHHCCVDIHQNVGFMTKVCLHRSRKHVAVIVFRPLAGPDRIAATMTGIGKK